MFEKQKTYANITKGSKIIICSSFAKKWEEFSSLKCSLHTLQVTKKCFLTLHQNMAYMSTSMIRFVVVSGTYDYIKRYELISNAMVVFFSLDISSIYDHDYNHISHMILFRLFILANWINIFLNIYIYLFNLAICHVIIHMTWCHMSKPRLTM